MEEIQQVNQLMEMEIMFTFLFNKECFIYFILCHTRFHLSIPKWLYMFFISSIFLPGQLFPSFSLKLHIFNHQDLDLSSKLCCRPSNTCPPHAGRRVDAHGRDSVGRRSWDTDAGRWWRPHSDLNYGGSIRFLRGGAVQGEGGKLFRSGRLGNLRED